MRGRVMAMVAGAALLAMAAVPARAQEPTIKVYVFTAGSVGGFVDAALTGRQQQVTDLRKGFLRTWWRDASKAVELVEDRSQADVSIEVLERGPLPAGTRITDASICPCWDFHVRLTVNADYSTDFHEPVGYRSILELVADDLARQIDKWFQQNTGRLLELRKQKK